MLQELMRSSKKVDVFRMRARDFLARQREIEQAKLRRIEGHASWKPVEACPACMSEERSPELEKYGIPLMRCESCGARYGTMIPADLSDVYRDEGYVSYSLEDTDQHYEYRRERFGLERVAILERYCGDLAKKKLLDVGCGNGYFLSVAKEKGGLCFGTEYSERLRQFTVEKTGLTVFDKDLDDLPERDFDIVTLFDVIEHVPHPQRLMKSVDALLNPGGHVLIFTPNFDSFSIRVMGQYSSIIDPTEHLVVYTLPSLERLGARLGYETVYRETQGLDIQNILALYHFQGGDPHPFLVQWEPELQAMVNAAQCGDYARIMLRKGRVGKRDAGPARSTRGAPRSSGGPGARTGASSPHGRPRSAPSAVRLESTLEPSRPEKQ